MTTEMRGGIQRLSRPEASRLRSSLVVPTLQRVLSELVQNSLDASATRIDAWVNITPGSESVRVEDDGRGMNEDELKAVGERYISSKSTDGWSGASSYGFRGEAVSSIAALALVEISSRSGEDTFSKVIKNGETLYFGPARSELSRSHGTAVTVREPFNSVPVRRAALGSSSTVSACKRVVETLALVHPKVVWNLWEDRPGGAKRLVSVHGTKTSLDVFRTLFGYAGVEKVQKIRVSSGPRRVDGFISLEGAVTKSHQHFYVNGYALEGSELQHMISRRFACSQYATATSDATENAAHGGKKWPSPRRLERHPIYVLNVTPPAEEVDAAYGPSKTVLGYKDLGRVETFVLAVIDDFLKRNGFSLWRETRSASPSPSKATSLTGKRRKNDDDNSISAKRLFEHRDGESLVQVATRPEHDRGVTDLPPDTIASGDNNWLRDFSNRVGNNVLSTRNPHTLQELPVDGGLSDSTRAADTTFLTNISQPTSDITFSLDSLTHPRVLRQVDRKFIPCVLDASTESGDTRKTLVIFDQHAADERAAVESIVDSLCDGFRRNDMAVTEIPEDQLRVILTREEVAALQPLALDVLRRWGIQLEHSGAAGEYVQVAVRAVPALLDRLARKETTELTRLLRLYIPLLAEDISEVQALIQSFEEGGGTDENAKIQRWMPREMVELANSKACRGAIMFGDRLDHDQCERLIGRLAATLNPWVCAHGRPTFTPLVLLDGRGAHRRPIDWAAWAHKINS